MKVIVEQFLGYVVENHHVSREPASIFQAFQLSMVSFPSFNLLFNI